MAQTITKKPGEDIIIVDEQTTPPPTQAYDVVAGTTETLTAGQPAVVTKNAAQSTPTKTVFDFKIPQGPKGDGSGGGTIIVPPAGPTYNLVNRYFNVREYGAKGDGTTDDWQSIQNALNAAIDSKGKLIIPAANDGRYYRINRTLDASRDQFWLYVEMMARRGQGIVYMGPSGSPADSTKPEVRVNAIKINGQKGGYWKGLEVKTGDDSTQGKAMRNATAIDIVTDGVSSTAGFSMYDCTVELNKGESNIGVRMGRTNNNGDISQILFSGVMVWGGGAANGASIPGQNGFQVDDGNTCQITWLGGGAAFTDHAFHLNRGTGFYMFSFGGSQNKVDYFMAYPSTITAIGNRWESGKQHMIQSGGGFAVIEEANALVSDYHPDNGRLYDMQTACSLKLSGIKMEQTMLDQRCIYLGGGGLGNLEVKGGAWQVSSADFVTIENANNWKLDIKGVGKLDSSYNVKSQFPNR